MNSIKMRIGNFMLSRELANQHRDVISCNLDNASKIGIIYNADDEKTYKIVKKYVLYLKEEGIRNIMALGYVQQGNIPHYLSTKLEFNYFTTKDVNWYYKPNCVTVNNFLEEPYDILIDLSSDDCFPLKYLLGKSPARMKVGKECRQKNKLYDMRLAIREAKTLPYLIEQLNHYLSIINKPKADVEQV